MLGVLFVSLAGSANADDDIVGTWSPTEATGEQWKPPLPVNVRGIEVSPTSVCNGSGRSWIGQDSPTRIVVTWRTCPRGAMPLLITNLPEIFGYTINPQIPGALPNGADRAALLPTGHVRQWLQGDRYVELSTECQSRDRGDCLALSAKVVNSLAAILPGQPSAGPSSPGPFIQTAIKAVLIALAAMVIVVPFVRRRRRVVRHGTTGEVRWVPVDAPARSLRGDAAMRRFWISMLWVCSGFGIFFLGALFFNSDSSITLASVGSSFFLVIVSGYRTLRRTNQPLLRRDWLRYGRTTRPALRERLVNGALTVFAGGVIVAGWVAVINVLSDEWYAIYLTDLERAVIGVALVLLTVLAFLAAGYAHRAELRAAWRFFNAAGGVPFIFLRDTSDDLIHMRRSPMIRRNGPLRFFDWIRWHPPVPFAPTIALLLARHGKLVAVNPPGPSLAETGATTVTLPLKDAADRARAARSVLLLAPTETEVPLAIPDDADSACVLLVIPPWSDAEFDGCFAAFKAVARAHPLLHELAEPWVSPATLVLVHVPGAGWRAWGAKDRSEWTYTVALDQAIAYASPRWDMALAERGVLARTGPEHEDKPRVYVHAHPVGVDTRVAGEIRTGLTEMGVDVVARPADAQAGCIVVLSNVALQDPAWLASAVELAGPGRDVTPVAIEAIHGQPPTELEGPNWVYWTTGPAKALADLFNAVNSRSSIYRRHRDLVTQARTWNENGRPRHLLISQRERAEDAARHVEHVERDLLAKPDPLTRDFVHASVARSTSLGRRLPWWALGMAVVLAIAAFAVKVTIADLQLRNKNNNLGVIVSAYAMSGMDNPGYLGLQSAALLLQGEGEQENLGRRGLIDALNQRWPITFLGSEHDAHLIDVAVGDKSPVYSIDVAGTLTTWDISSAQATARHFVAEGLRRMDVSSDGGLIVVAERSKLHVIRPQPWHDDVIELPAPISDVALAASADEITVALADGRLVSAAIGKPLRTIGTYAHIMALRSTVDGLSRALVQAVPGVISVIDPANGTVLGTSRVELPPVNLSGALGSDGESVAVVDADRRIRFGPISDLRTTGQFVPDTMDSLVVLSPNTLLFASAQFGTQVYDRRSGLTTARLASPEAGATRIRVSPHGGLILTHVGHIVFVWQPIGLTSIAEPDIVQNKGTSAMSARHGIDAAGTPDGAVTVGGRSISAVTGRVMVTAIADDGRSVLVGSDRGEVAEVDTDPGIVVRRWDAPDRAPVTTLGWAQRPEQMLIQTASGRWWTAEACNGCGSDATLLAAFMQRLPGCYRPNNVEQITETVRQALGLRFCAKSPRAEGL